MVLITLVSTVQMANKLKKFGVSDNYACIPGPFSSRARALQSLRLRRYDRLGGVGKSLISHQDYQRTCRLASAFVALAGGSCYNGPI